MLITILAFLTLTPAQVSAQTLAHLDALNNITAVQETDGKRHAVLIADGQQLFRQGDNYTARLPRARRGLYFGSEWSAMLRESLVWPLRGDGEHFTFVSLCPWEETIDGKPWTQFVSCSGVVETDGAGNIQRIIKRLDPQTKLTRTVTVEVHYQLVRLSTPRLVPSFVRMTARLSTGWQALTARWSDYREYRGAEPVVSEIDGPASVAPLSGDSVIKPAPVIGEDLGEPPPVPALRSTTTQPRTADLLQSELNGTVQQRKLGSRWKRLFRF